MTFTKRIDELEKFYSTKRENGDISYLLAACKRMREQLDQVEDWLAANEPEMECRGDSDCDHCVLVGIVRTPEDKQK